MKLPVKKAIKIPDGEHLGVIINIRYRSKPYEYIDVEIEFPIDMQTIQIKCGYPQLITANSKLGQLLTRFGEKLYEGISIDPDEVLIGKKCKFKTFTETNQKGSFAKVDDTSLRPAESIIEYIEEKIEMPKL